MCRYFVDICQAVCEDSQQCVRNFKVDINKMTGGRGAWFKL